MDNQSFGLLLGKKLREIRENLGYTLKEVAEKFGLNNYQVLSSIESGDRQLKTTELLKLANIYQCDFKKLIHDLEKPVIISTVIWREKSSIENLAGLESIFLKLCENYQYMENMFNIKTNTSSENIKANASEFNFPFVKAIADDLFKKLGFGDRPALTIHKIIEDKLGIKILYLDLHGKGSGASTVGKDGPAILINASDAPWRRNYDIAHELFHIITWDIFPADKIHCRNGKNKKSEIEQYADYFASCLLLPHTNITKEFHSRLEKGKITYIDCIDMAKDYGVSIDALLWGLVNAKLVSSKQAEKALRAGTLKDMDKNLRMQELQNNPKPYLSERYISLALKAYQKGFISQGVLANFLLVDRYEVRKVLTDNGFGEKENFDLEISSS